MGDKLLSIYETFLAHYGELNWWPAKTPYEVMAGAVLTQNTAWSNVGKAIANFGGDLSPEAVLNADMAGLTEKIRPAGFFNQKAAYLKAVTEWFGRYGFDVPTVRREPLSKLRAELLATNGVGPETADSILLYAFGFPTFVVDAYTVRFCDRYPIGAGKGYAAVKAHFEQSIPRSADLYNNFHALIVINAKEHCAANDQIQGKVYEYFKPSMVFGALSLATLYYVNINSQMFYSDAAHLTRLWVTSGFWRSIFH